MLTLCDVALRYLGSHLIFFFFPFIFISWRLITLQNCSGFCHTLAWISHGFTCVSPSPHLILIPAHFRGWGNWLRVVKSPGQNQPVNQWWNRTHIYLESFTQVRISFSALTPILRLLRISLAFLRSQLKYHLLQEAFPDAWTMSGLPVVQSQYYVFFPISIMHIYNLYFFPYLSLNWEPCEGRDQTCLSHCYVPALPSTEASIEEPPNNHLLVQKKPPKTQTSLVAPWIRVHLPMQGDMSSIPDLGRPHMLQSN